MDSRLSRDARIGADGEGPRGLIGGANLIGIFAQWGAIQLILALLYWVVTLRYRFLVLLALASLLLEHVLRLGVGLLKPLVVASPPPGVYGSNVLLPLSAVALVLSLRQRKGL